MGRSKKTTTAEFSKTKTPKVLKMPPLEMKPAEPKKIILKNHQSPGDIVMLAYGLKALHEQYPNRYLTGVDTSCDAIFEGNPYVCWELKNDPTAKVISAEYNTIHQSNQKSVTFINSFICDLEDKLDIRLRPTDWQGAIFIRDEEKSWYSAIREILGKDVPFWIVDAGHKFDFTAKAWEYTRFQQVVDYFPDITFVQIGAKEHKHPKLTGNNLIDLVGKTDLRQLIRLVYNSFGVVTPVSLPHHLSYAVPPHPRFNRKSRASIVIAGGREPNHWQQGANQQYLHTCGMLSCCDLGGCWKSRIVPLGDGDSKDEDLCLNPVESKSGQIIPRCLDMITVEDVCKVIEKYMNNLNYDNL